MPLYINEDFLQFDYENDEQSYDEKAYFEEEGSKKFDESTIENQGGVGYRLSYEH